MVKVYTPGGGYPYIKVNFTDQFIFNSEMMCRLTHLDGSPKLRTKAYTTLNDDSVDFFL